jgi:hypothetical protein
MMRQLLTVTAMAVGLVLGSGGLAGAAEPATSPWTVQPTPLPPRDLYGHLDGVSCASAVQCVAVGDTNRQTFGAALAEIWNGTKWVPHNITKPGIGGAPYLTAVSCPATDSCVAVGTGPPGGTSVAMSWNGTTWTIMPGSQASPDAELYGVSCVTASDCIAVGYTDTTQTETLAMSWNGTTWTVDSMPTFTTASTLGAVSCASATSCLATGSLFSGPPLAEAWNGSAWTVLPTPPAPAGATAPYPGAVSCPSAAECMTVGEYFNSAGLDEPLADLWNGSAWVPQTVPAQAIGGFLNGVSCPAAARCTAVGYSRGLTDSWDGTRWTRQNVPRPPNAKYLYSMLSVSCAAARTCEAVGIIQVNRGNGRDLLPLTAGE